MSAVTKDNLPSKVALIFGYGPRVGVDVARAYAEKGYRVAIVSRSQQTGKDVEGYLTLEADLCDPSTVETVFSTVIEKLGHPSVVVYNASGSASMFNRDTPPSEFIPAFQADYNVNVVSAYAAAHLAIRSFEARGPSAGTYIYTGNKLNYIVVPPLLSQGIGKAGAAHMINYLVEEYSGDPQAHKFYFVDERKADGSPAYSRIDGPAHAKVYLHLTEEELVQGPWLYTFVKDKGYVNFKEAIPQPAGRLDPPNQ